MVSDSSKHFVTSAGLSVDALRTEFLLSPMGVENPKPLLSWELNAQRRSARQSAYHIEVASSAELLEAGRADLWDSGCVSSNRTLAIAYEGAALSSRQRCFWRVHVWDESGVVSIPSAVAHWEMGLLHPTDWSANWLAAESRAMREERPSELRSLRGAVGTHHEEVNFRLNFSVANPARATLYLTAHGNPEVWIDGKNVAKLDYSLTSPQEIEAEIDVGQHTIAIALKRENVPVFEEDGDIAAFLRLRFEDGSIRKLSHDGWKTSVKGVEGWQTIDFDDQDWAAAESMEQLQRLPWPTERATLLRRAFSATKALQHARIYATALGAYELYLNGARVGDALLSPESTDFKRRALYRVYDVTKQIASGDNVLGVMVGAGWYGSSTFLAGRYPWGPPPKKILVQLELTYTDGSSERIGSGNGWSLSDAPVLSSEIYDGELYDARLEEPGWSSPRFNASRWETAEIASKPPVALTAQISPPIKREKTLSAKSINEPRPGVFVFDFGQNFAGWCRLAVKGSEGTTVVMQFAELLKRDGEIDQANLIGAGATDTYIMKGDPAGEVFEPHFTYHGFRYVQVTGLPSAPTPETLKGIVVHSDLPVTGKLDIDNPLIESLWQNTLWSQRSNFMGIPTDCPQRSERLGWTGDARVFWDTAAFNMDVDAFTRRYMCDMRDAQAENGAFPDYSPAATRFPAQSLPNPERRMQQQSNWNEVGASAGWSDAGVWLPWILWWRYGDTGIIEENWQAMSRYIQFVIRANPDYIWRNGRGVDWGDWLAFDATYLGDSTTPNDLVATAEWANSVACMAEMADATARTQQAALYRKMWANIALAFQKSFVRADGSIGNGSHTGYILALRFNLVPNGLRAAAAAKLVDDVKRRGTLLSTGFLGTPHSLDVLADAGYSELVYDLLLRTESPSWGYMIKQGATTIWESWNQETAGAGSRNHYALGAVCGFLFRRIAAISPLEAGFGRIEFDPVLDPRVKKVSGRYKSVRGEISTRWEQKGDSGFTLDLSLPPNTTARVHLPSKETANLTESGQLLSDNSHVAFEAQTKDRVILQVASGIYHFEVT